MGRIHPWFRQAIVYMGLPLVAEDALYRFVTADVLLRESLTKRLKPAGLAQVEIERSINRYG